MLSVEECEMVRRIWSGLLLLGLVWFSFTGGAIAAEVMSIRDGGLLRVGDSNRSFGIRIACIDIPPARAEEARTYLQQQLPRRTRVNFRLTGRDGSEGPVVGEIYRLPDGTDLATGLLESGLATIREGELVGCPSANLYRQAAVRAAEAGA